MGNTIKEGFLTERNMDSVFIVGKLDQLMKVGTLMTRNMGMANLSQEMIKSLRENGLMEKDKEEEY